MKVDSELVEDVWPFLQFAVYVSVNCRREMLLKAGDCTEEGAPGRQIHLGVDSVHRVTLRCRSLVKLLLLELRKES